ncbi:MAG: purine-nucleoside phosphorylase, partial [Verrucomicrobiota bacterium]|nr:purine-nucleoside phosphorylase [Verrucomicrobiota bacterium]
DHLNFMGDNPLRGPSNPRRDRFTDLTQTYDPAIAKQLKAAARKTKIKLHSGTYCAVSGPSYETPAEINAYRKLGADAIGMSTVPEAIVARQCGVRVAAISCITNEAAGSNNCPLSHSEVLETGLLAAKTSSKLLGEFAHNYA